MKESFSEARRKRAAALEERKARRTARALAQETTASAERAARAAEASRNTAAAALGTLSLQTGQLERTQESLSAASTSVAQGERTLRKINAGCFAWCVVPCFKGVDADDADTANGEVPEAETATISSFDAAQAALAPVAVPRGGSGGHGAWAAATTAREPAGAHTRALRRSMSEGTGRRAPVGVPIRRASSAGSTARAPNAHNGSSLADDSSLASEAASQESALDRTFDALTELGSISLSMRNELDHQDRILDAIHEQADDVHERVQRVNRTGKMRRAGG